MDADKCAGKVERGKGGGIHTERGDIHPVIGRINVNLRCYEDEADGAFRNSALQRQPRENRN